MVDQRKGEFHRNYVDENPDDVSNRFWSCLLYDTLQALVTFWVITLSYLYSYIWRQHSKRKFLFCLFFVIPTVLTFGFMISGILTSLVVFGKFYGFLMKLKDRLFSRRRRFTPGGSRVSDRRHRSGSSASVVSVISEELFVGAPLCRRHSRSNTSLPSRQLSEVNKHIHHHSSASASTTASASTSAPAPAPSPARASPVAPVYTPSSPSDSSSNSSTDYDN